MSKDDFIVITSVNCYKDGNYVILDPSEDSGDEAIFLKNPEKRDDGKYKAIKVTHTEAAEIIKNNTIKKKDPEEEEPKEKTNKEKTNKENTSDSRIPLFCIHGFSNEPSSIIDDIVEKREFFESSKYFPVFVIWACSDKGYFRDYGQDSDIHSQKSGRAFFDFVDTIPDETFPRKSLLMHSMGNHVVFDGACLKGAPKVQFENIFMVAADVPHDGFHKNPVGYWTERNKEIWGNKNKKANNFYEMLAKGTNGKPKGKIVVLHNGSDKALGGSSWFKNWERRLGQRGMGTYRSKWNGGIYYDPNYCLIEKFKKCHVNEDCRSWAVEHLGSGHSYQFKTEAIEIYDKYAIEKTKNL